MKKVVRLEIVIDDDKELQQLLDSLKAWVKVVRVSVNRIGDKEELMKAIREACAEDLGSSCYVGVVWGRLKKEGWSREEFERLLMDLWLKDGRISLDFASPICERDWVERFGLESVDELYVMVDGRRYGRIRLR